MVGVGSFGASFMQGELSRFARELRILRDGEAILAPLEPNLELSVAGDGKGDVKVKGTARNNFHTGTQPSFRLDLNQAYLPAIAKALADADS